MRAPRDCAAFVYHPPQSQSLLPIEREVTILQEACPGLEMESSFIRTFCKVL